MNPSRNKLMYSYLGIAVVLVIVFGVVSPVMAQNDAENEKQNLLDKILSYIDTIAKAIGGFLVFVINEITGIKLSNLVMPLGYLGEITVILLALELIEGARKVLWFLILAGWALITIRIVMEILQTKSA